MVVYVTVYCESIKQELKFKPISECRYDERLKTKSEESTHLTYTGLLGALEHLKIKTRLMEEKKKKFMTLVEMYTCSNTDLGRKSKK
jgi:hypothetical protein